MRLHVLDTGRVRIRPRQMEPHPRDALRVPATLLDRGWTGWLPIWSFAIEHPGGVIVVDAGQDPAFAPPWWDVFSRTAVRFDVAPADLLERRLADAGVEPANVRHHVFTHLHVDHVGTGPLPGVRPTVAAAEWRAATARTGRALGYVRHDFHGQPETVAGDHDLLGDGTVRLLATPGHTEGHQSVLVTPPEGPRWLIAGDAVYSEQALLEGRIDGVGRRPGAARASIARLQAVCREAPTVVLPAHDPDARDRHARDRVTAVR